MAVRLNKYLADRGIAARRKCDQLIEEGRVTLNGKLVREVGIKIDENRDRVAVDGQNVGGRSRTVYYVINKPVGVITTLDDPQGRRTIREFLPRGARVYPVGRLDADTSGLLLLTNDGELAHKLMHPRYGVQKVYRVRLSQEPRGDQLRRLASGVRFDKGLVSGPARVRRIDPGFDAIMIELIIHEGRFRQVRKMCEAVGLPVSGLHRVGYGPIRLGPLAKGMFRELSDEEVTALRAAASRPGGTGSTRIAGSRDEGKPVERMGRPARPDAAPARGEAKPARPVRATKPAPPVDDEVDADEPDEIEDSWVAGGGFLPQSSDDDDAKSPVLSELDFDEEAEDDDGDGVTYVGGVQ
ncbi:MAG: pseudouridine synthase, partial [Candidatus Eisenbacteria bacterium]|nr:pseudouridine synthase [Candidatus Eisenbacteria bacterium]